jgi:integrase
MNYELIYNLLKDDKRNNKKTLDFYVKNILKIYNDFDNKDITKLHIQDFYDYFNLHKYSNHTQKNKLISLYVYFDKLDIDNKLMADIKTSIDSLKDKIDEKYETHEKNDKEKKELLTKQDFKDLIDSFKPKSKTIK